MGFAKINRCHSTLKKAAATRVPTPKLALGNNLREYLQPEFPWKGPQWNAA
jgi:hypothetical protein